jgi:hypothetical protein
VASRPPGWRKRPAGPSMWRAMRGAVSPRRPSDSDAASGYGAGSISRAGKSCRTRWHSSRPMRQRIRRTASLAVALALLGTGWAAIGADSPSASSGAEIVLGSQNFMPPYHPVGWGPAHPRRSLTLVSRAATPSESTGGLGEDSSPRVAASPGSIIPAAATTPNRARLSCGPTPSVDAPEPGHGHTCT